MSTNKCSNIKFNSTSKMQREKKEKKSNGNNRDDDGESDFNISSFVVLFIQKWQRCVSQCDLMSSALTVIYIY